MNYPIITINELNNSPITHKDQTVILLGPNGEKTSYYRNCNPHREDGPADIRDGKEVWCLYGKTYSKEEHHAVLNKLTTVTTGEVEAHFVNGIHHRDDGPAYISATSVKYYQHGKLHRVDGPAELYNGTETCSEDWYLNGLRHRVGGPAIICPDLVAWFQNGKRHRMDGPALIITPDTQFAAYVLQAGKSLIRWYHNDVELPEEKVKALTRNKNLIPLL